MNLLEIAEFLNCKESFEKELKQKYPNKISVVLEKLQDFLQEEFSEDEDNERIANEFLAEGYEKDDSLLSFILEIFCNKYQRDEIEEIKKFNLL